MRSVSLRSFSYGLLLFVWSLGIAAAIPATAQQASNPPMTQDEINQQLLQRVQELEEEVKQLKAQLNPAASTTAPAAVAAAVPGPAAVPTTAPAPAPPAEEEVSQVNEVAPRLKLQVYGDLGGQKVSHNSDTFLLGSADIFMTARLSDKMTTLGEVLFQSEGDNSISLDIERLFLRYQQSRYLAVTVGRYHTWVGYYNSTYNKAELLETTADRPFMYAFDDDGGVMPMQDVGVNLTGKIPSGNAGLHYVLEFGNGRAWGLNTEPTQNNQDANNGKSINGGLFVRPENFPSLQLGFSLRHDNLTVPGPAIGETIATAHAVFNNGSYEILNEAALVRHDEAGGPVFNTSAFYTQFSRAFHSYRPYFRYQYFNASSGDPVYVYASPNDFSPAYVDGFVGRVNGPTVGVRYDFNENSAIKFQYDRISLRGLPTADVVTSQLVFSF
jgi:hypothetical protein